MIKRNSLTAATLALMFLAACSSTGGLGDILGGGTGAQTYEIRGTVESVDTRNNTVYLSNVTGYNNMLSGSNSSVGVHFDQNTEVYWQNQTYRPQDLERGDQVTVLVDESGNQLHAESMTVTYNVSSGTGTNYPSNNYGTIRGTVRSIDTYNRTITLESASWISQFQSGGSTSGLVTVRYDNNTSVDVSGQLHPVGNLERGDVIDVQVQNSGSSSSYFANRIFLVRDVRR
jgi:hypothetical protein